MKKTSPFVLLIMWLCVTAVGDAQESRAVILGRVTDASGAGVPGAGNMLLATPDVSAQTPSARPNVVLIIADDLAWDDSGAYGNKSIRTPNIDRLAREGLKFTSAFVTISSCSPSRSSLITGRYPHNTDAEQLHWPLPAEQVTFVEKLRAAGYWTAASGKWHLGNAVKDRFDVVNDAGEAGFQTDPKTGKMLAKDDSGAAGWLPTMRRRPKSEPFFLWLAALDPHRDYVENSVPKPHRPGDVIVPPYLPDTPEVRRELALYYDEIARLDDYVGKVVAELERQGVAENTLVLFMSDNGRPFPRAKTTLYDSGVKTPLIARWPKTIRRGGVADGLVSSVDIAPTILQLAGVAIPPTVQGKSFAAILTDPKATTRDAIYAEKLNQWGRETDDRTPARRTPDEFDRETGQPLPTRRRPRPSKQELLTSAAKAQGQRPNIVFILADDLGYADVGFNGGHDWRRDDKASYDEGYSTHLLANEAVKFIQEKGGKQLFFLYVPFNAVHSPHQVPENYSAPYANLKEPRRTYAGMLAAMDEAIGQILAALDEKGLRRQTLIIFSSDNGGPAPGRVTDNGPLRAGKGRLYEGGVREPLIVWGPGWLPPSRRGAWDKTTVLSSVDLAPSLDSR